MGLFPVDKGNDFLEEGKTLITEYESERYLEAHQKRSKQFVRSNNKRDELYNIPEDRLSRPSGGPGGFDDYVERWHE